MVTPLSDGRQSLRGVRAPLPGEAGAAGICKVRFIANGTLLAPAGYVAALQCDPRENLFSVFPGPTPYVRECWAAISIAATAKLAHVAGAAPTTRLRRFATDVTAEGLVACPCPR